METRDLLDIANLSVAYGDKTILDTLDVKMPYGAIGLLGPNGAGKSTLLKTIMGFLPPSTGSIKVLGYNPASFGPTVRRMIGYMPEEDTFIPSMSAVEFVAYCGQLCGLPHKDAMLRAHLVLHYCGLGEARYRKVETFSTGMLQRVKLAQAIVHDPKLLLLDEPTNGLDPAGRKSMLELIRDVSHDKGISVILSSHILPDVEHVCDQMMVLFKGKLATSGYIQELKQLAQISYEVRVKGDSGQFTREIINRGGTCGQKDNKDGVLRVQLSETQGTDEVFSAARAANAQIRHLLREEMTLQEVFSKAIHEV